MPDQFTTIKDNSQGYYTEKRSKFLAFAHHVETTEEIKLLIAAYRKKYHDARHVCHAYTLGPDRACYHASDDGEPSSTAGKPILGQINTNNLTDIVIIVVRYYGGINLGTSRLIAASRRRRCTRPRLHRDTLRRTARHIPLPLSTHHPGHANRQRDGTAHRQPHLRRNMHHHTCHQTVTSRATQKKT